MTGPSKSVRVGILSASLGEIPSSFRLPTRQALEIAAGRNTGNLAFRYAVTQHITSAKVHVPWSADPEWVREECELLVIPSSNQANPREDFGHRADFLEAVGLPCVAVGLGAQAAELGADVTFPPGTLRYLRILSERSTRVGVRGSYTADVLARAGVKNTVVVGCPSNFINPLTTLGAAIEWRLRSGEFHRLAVTAGDLTPEHRQLERKLFGWLLKLGGAYVCQSHPCLVSLARNRLDEMTLTQVDQIRRYLQSSSNCLRPRAKFLTMAQNLFRVFFDAGAWLEFLTTFDLAAGTRIHGNLLAVQAGIPGVCIYHDARTEELCRTIGLPSVSVKDFLLARHPRDLVELTAFQGHAFDRTRTVLAREYRNLLAGCGIGVSAELNQLAQGVG